MPSVNKQSLREEFDQLKGEFEHLSEGGKVTAESRALFRAMIMLYCGWIERITILTRGAEELPPIPPRQKGKRGKIAKSDAHNLWERLKKHETAVLLFAKLSHVPFTNNRAERDLRMSKVKQKVSGCFRTRKYAEAYCRYRRPLRDYEDSRPSRFAHQGAASPSSLRNPASLAIQPALHRCAIHASLEVQGGHPSRLLMAP